MSGLFSTGHFSTSRLFISGHWHILKSTEVYWGLIGLECLMKLSTMLDHNLWVRKPFTFTRRASPTPYRYTSSAVMGVESRITGLLNSDTTLAALAVVHKVKAKGRIENKNLDNKPFQHTFSFSYLKSQIHLLLSSPFSYLEVIHNRKLTCCCFNID